MYIKLLAGFLLAASIFFPALLLAQSAPAAPIQEAERLMEDGLYLKAAEQYKTALKTAPDNVQYLYGLAMAYYRAENYKKAIEFAEKCLQAGNATIETYRLLSNSYDLNGEYDKGMATLRKGLEKYPGAGEFYVDMGIIEYLRNKPQEAVEHWEAGMKAAPHFADNYFFATQIFLQSNKKVWALLYGETFMNIERGTTRSDSVSRQLFHLYKGVVQDSLYLTRGTINFPVKTKNNMELAVHRIVANLHKNGMMNPQRAVKPNGETNMLKMVSLVRQNFLETWMQSFMSLYANTLFSYHRKLYDQNYLEAYTYWLFSSAATNDFWLWQTNNTAKYDKFIDWFLGNRMRVDTDNYFVRQQYDKQ